MLIIALCCLLVPQSEDQRPQIKLATELAQRFYAALESGNMDSMLPMCQLPWYHDGQCVVQQADILKVELKKLFDNRDTSQGKRVADVKLVMTYAATKDRMPSKDRVLLDQVVKDDDYLVLVMLKSADVTVRKSENVVLLARIKDGKAMAIGVKHTQ
ncbi:MAG TPA: hypothetical protein PLX97_11355 [Gemmatales bacterium]|nr:hypothetical protein [Gemmatales bacterium]